MVQIGTVSEISHGLSADRCRYTILLAHPSTEAIVQLRRIGEISDVQVDGDRYVIEYKAGRDAAAKLLAELVRARLPVASFSANSAGLEEAYLRHGIRQVD
jgi:hypothetical protein